MYSRSSKKSMLSSKSLMRYASSPHISFCPAVGDLSHDGFDFARVHTYPGGRVGAVLSFKPQTKGTILGRGQTKGPREDIIIVIDISVIDIYISSRQCRILIYVSVGF